MKKPTYQHHDLVQADKVITEAQLSLNALVKDVYPAGDSVRVKLGAHIVLVQITDHHTAYWSSAGYLFGVNLKTGRTRKFHFSQIVIE